MSLQTMKRKTTAKLNISGKGPKQKWMTQGPHGESQTHVISTGFSLNGGHRNVGRVGQINREVTIGMDDSWIQREPSLGGISRTSHSDGFPNQDIQLIIMHYLCVKRTSKHTPVNLSSLYCEMSMVGIIRKSTIVSFAKLHASY